MYYLLENNNIIDSENLPKNWEIFNISFDRMYVKIFEDIIITLTFDIKKQSENVFDLVEKGDLVNTIVDSIYQVVIIAKNVVIAPQEAFDLAVVTAIYKPDSKGNYIKVWEKKDE